MSLHKDILLWSYWNPLRKVIQKTPPAAMYALARHFGLMLHHVLPEKRIRLQEQLGFIRGSQEPDESSEKIVQDAFINLMLNEFEVLKFPVLTPQNLSCFVSLRGLEHLEDALSMGKGAVLIFAHFGASQMIMPAIGHRGLRMCQLSAPATVWKEKLRHRMLSSMEQHAMDLRWQHERSLPVKHISIFGSIKEAFSCLRRNDVLGIAIDGGGGGKRVAVNFLKHKALFSTGGIHIALRTGSQILPTFMVREKSGRNQMIIQAPLPINDYKPEDRAVFGATQAFAEMLEAYVYRFPAHYLNFLALRSFMAEQGNNPFFVE